MVVVTFAQIRYSGIAAGGMSPVFQVVGLRYPWVVQEKRAGWWLGSWVWAPFETQRLSWEADVTGPDVTTQRMCQVRRVGAGPFYQGVL